VKKWTINCVLVEVGSTPFDEPALVNVGSFAPTLLRVEPDHTGLGRRLESEHASALVA